MRKDHRPYFIKHAFLKLQKFYANRFLSPQFERLGRGHSFIKPWHVEIFGSPVSIGKFSTIIATSDKKVRLSVWSAEKNIKGIKIGDHCLISPGARISAASEITIGNDCMIASSAYLTDSDWHGVYDRSLAIGKTLPVCLKDNVWVGDSAIICKGVTIGENSIIGAGAVVTKDIPPNTIAAGNPAVVVKKLDPELKITGRSSLYSSPEELSKGFKELDRENLKQNTVFHWIRSILFPRKGD